MPSVAYGNTLTDLGRNIAEQKASEQALAGILAQVGAQKLAALNALAANRGRTQAERDVGMDRNATTRQVAMLESALRAQELADRERMAAAGLTAAEALARLEGTNRLAVAGVPYGPDALKMTEALARLQMSQLNPRVAETMFTENAERERQNLEAQNIASDANRLASIAFQEFQREMGSFTPVKTDKKIMAEYNNAIGAILQRYGDKASLLRTVPRPGGKIEFEALQLPIIRPPVPQVPTQTGTTNAVPVVPSQVPVPVPQARAVPNMAIPLMSRPQAPIAVPQFAVPVSQSNLPASTVIDAAAVADLKQRVLAFAQSLRDAGIPDADIVGRVYNAFPQARGLF